MDVEQLIARVRQRPAIWDRRSKLHSNRKAVEQCWSEISKEMGMDEYLLRKKWKYVRDQFSVECGKAATLRSGNFAEERKWPYFHLLMFMKDSVKPRTTPANPSRDTEDNSNSCDFQSSPRKFGDEDELIEETTVAFDESVDNDHMEKSVEEDPFNVTRPSTSAFVDSAPTSVQKTLSSYDSDALGLALIDIERQKLKYLQRKFNRTVDKEADDDCLFFRSLLPHVRKIPDCNKMAFRIRVQQLVDEFVYQEKN